MKLFRTILFAMMQPLLLNLAAAEQSNCVTAAYDINGVLVGTAKVVAQPLTIEGRLLPPTTIFTRNGQPIHLAAGIYFLGRAGYEENSIPVPAERFFFEDVTPDYLPLEEWDAGDVELADLNDDGLEDIVFSRHTSFYDGYSDYRPRVWIQSPERSFFDETESRMPPLPAPCYDIELFDVDSDNDVDLFVTGYLSASYYLPAGLFINNGSGVFSDEGSSRLPQLPDSSFAYFAEAADINNDQIADIVVNVFHLNATGHLFIKPELWLNDGNGYFAQDTLGRLPDPHDYGFFELITTDIDNDNLNDIIFANLEIVITDEYGNPIDTLSGWNACYRNTGDGFFVDETETRMPEPDNPDTRDLATSDADNDGDLDILEVGLYFGDYERQVRLLDNDGEGYYTVSDDAVPVGLSGWFNDSQFALLDGDEFPDLFMTRVLPGEPYYDVLLVNNGDGSFADSSQLLPANLDFSVSSALFDHQQDDDIDILAANSGGNPHEYGRNVLYHNMLRDLVNVSETEDLSLKSFDIFFTYPNPFNSYTLIEYELPQASYVSVNLYDVMGRKVKTLLSHKQEPGSYRVVWDGTDSQGHHLSSGVYFYRVNAGEFAKSGKIVLAR